MLENKLSFPYPPPNSLPYLHMCAIVVGVNKTWSLIIELVQLYSWHFIVVNPFIKFVQCSLVATSHKVQSQWQAIVTVIFNELVKLLSHTLYYIQSNL